MPASPAQIAASRANGPRSKGPVSACGKLALRRNALKHGMAGQGVVLPEEDSAEVDRRSAAMVVEMRPSGEMGRYLVNRLARLTVCVERCSSQELAAIAYRASHAEAAFDEARIAEVDETLDRIAREPATYSRKLRSMPEGIDRLIARLLDLREELNTGRWDWTYGDKLAQLTGSRWMEIPVTRVRALSEAIIGDFRYLLPSEGEGLSTSDRVDWARNAMADRIDEELEMLWRTARRSMSRRSSGTGPGRPGGRRSTRRRRRSWPGGTRRRPSERSTRRSTSSGGSRPRRRRESRLPSRSRRTRNRSPSTSPRVRSAPGSGRPSARPPGPPRDPGRIGIRRRSGPPRGLRRPGRPAEGPSEGSGPTIGARRRRDRHSPAAPHVHGPPRSRPRVACSGAA
jgi:hypothetical protein